MFLDLESFARGHSLWRRGRFKKGESLFGMLFDRIGRRLGKRGDILRKGIGKLLVFRK